MKYFSNPLETLPPHALTFNSWEFDEHIPLFLLYLFPERFVPSPAVSRTEHLPTSRIAVSSAWLALETLTAACWYLHQQRLIALEPYIRARPLFALRYVGRRTAQRLLGHSRRGVGRYLIPPGRIRATRLARFSTSAAIPESLERELWEAARASASPIDLRRLLFRWFADAFERLEDFQIPPVQVGWARRISIGDADHRVLWTVENAAIAHGYIERLPVYAEPGVRRHGDHAFPGAFARVLLANPEPLVRLKDSLDAFEAEWAAFRTEGAGLYSVIRAECERVLERLGPSG